VQIRCSTCTKTIAIAPTGVLPPACPHCQRSPVPDHLGAYRLDRLLATGGMGEVYLAHHEELGTEVAIKLLPALPLDTVDAVRKRFAREARLTAKVAHPGVVRVISSDAHEDRPYLVLELVSGQTLRQAMKSRMSPEQSARIIADIAEVLAAAHQQGVLHRDIKPDNVMIDAEGGVRVLDFGIARAIADDAPLTRTGELVGTPEYMAPEQLLDGPEATDARTDVHALGVMLYEMLTGRSPFRSANVFQSLKLVESLVPESPVAAGAPSALAAVAMRALEKLPEDRFQTAEEFVAALGQAVPAIRTVATEVPPSRWPLRLGIAGCLLGAVALVVAVVYAQPTASGAGASQQPVGPVVTSAGEDLRLTAEQQRELLEDGRFLAALQQAEAAFGDGDGASRQNAQVAFLLSHATWFRVAGLPAWLAAYDMRHRERLFGDQYEPVGERDQQLRDLLLGDAEQWQAFAASAAAPAMLRDLLALPELALAERLLALQTLASRLPVAEPEHWLARTIARHLRGDRPGARQAAEMAWLHGAGELAVLLEAAMAMPTLSPAERQPMWRRIARSDQADCPASTLLLLRLEAKGVAGVEFDPQVARTFPAVFQPAASDWFVAQAALEDEAEQYGLLRIAAQLGREPDFDQAPWSEMSKRQRQRIEQEYRSVR